MKKHIEATAAASAAAATIEVHGATKLEPLVYMDLGDCAAIAELKHTLKLAASSEDYMESQLRTAHSPACCLLQSRVSMSISLFSLFLIRGLPACSLLCV